MDAKELSEEEITILLREPKKPVKAWDPVVYRGLDVSSNRRVEKVTLERVVRKTVPVEDAELLIKHGWKVVEDE